VPSGGESEGETRVRTVRIHGCGWFAGWDVEGPELARRLPGFAGNRDGIASFAIGVRKRGVMSARRRS